MESLLQNPPGASKDKQSYQNANDWIGDIPGEQIHDQSCQKGTNGAEGITHDMQVCAAYIDVLLGIAFAHKGPGADQIS
ncbi:hypothetical protein D3C79_1062720 [compost metagenome]